MKLHEDAWLSERFGHPVYNVDPSGDLGPFDGGAVPASYAAKVPTTALDRVHALADAGFKLIDTAVTLSRASDARVARGTSGVAVRPARPDDRDAVLDVASSSFTESRFHADPVVPGPVADQIKRDWAGAYFSGERGDRLLVADVDGAIAGFVALLATGAGSERTHVIDLIAVARAAQSRGAGTALVAAAVAEPGAALVRVGTQIRNTASLRLYLKAGFVIESSSYVLHKHAVGH